MSRLTVMALFLIVCAGCAQAGRETVVRGNAFDGGDIAFDGTFYDYVDAKAKKGITLWIPPNVPFVRGVLFHGNPGGGGGDTRAIPRDPALQEFAARFGFGIAGVTWFPGRQVRTETGQVILGVFRDWAKMGRNPELANVPLIARGSSNAGVTAYALACVAPDRMICITPNVGPSYGPWPPPDGTLQVPALMHVGPGDPFFTQGVKDTTELFSQASPRGALWAWDAEQGKKHEIGHIDDVDMAYYEACIRLRLPADADPRQGPVKLNPLRREDGWLADAGTWSAGARGATEIAPFGEYAGDRQHAVWLPDRDVAFLYRAIATYDNPLTLRVEGLKAVDNPNASGTLLRSVGGNVVDPGAKLVLICQPAAGYAYERIEFYRGGEKIGEARSGEAPRCETVADGSHAANAFVALARQTDGTVRTSYPVHVIVRDPKISAALAAYRAVWQDDIVPPGPKPAPGSTADAPKEPAKPSPDDAVLVAYGLTAAEEATFGAAEGVAGFWTAFGPQHDRASIAPARHAREPAKVDASMTVKAAHSRAGLYLLFEVQDGPSGSGGATDGVDFHIARDAAADLWTGRPVESRFSAAQYTLARSETQYQAAFGAPDKPETTLRRTYPCPFTMFVFRSYTVAEAKEKHGIVVRRHFLGNGRRAMEWFIPWAYVGKPGRMQEPAVGTRLGLVLGYNAAANLRWPAGVDPWAQAVEKGPDPNPWGDLEIGLRF